MILKMFNLHRIADLDTEISSFKEKNSNLNEEVKRLKSNLNYKSDEIDQLQKRVARLNTVIINLEFAF